MLNATISGILESHLKPAEHFIWGFANLTGLLHEKFKEYSFGISIGRRLDDKIIDGIKDAPTLEYLEHYSGINRQLDSVSEKIAADLKKAGIDAIPVKTTVYSGPEEFDRNLPDLRYEVSHKMTATRAGLGWIGKTDLFVSKEFGTRLRLTTILIDREVTPRSEPINKSRCGQCSICVDKCPAGAANGRLWEIHTDRDVFFDAFKCRDKCSELGRNLLKTDKRICGLCVAVCPIGLRRSPGP
jgi:epoxyqueuosine reductase